MEARALPPPERMRAAVDAYVRALHGAYLGQGRLMAPAELGRMPLVRAGSFWVAAVGARHLHLLATGEPLEAVHAREVSAAGELAPLHWTLRFYDPVVIPALGLIAETEGPATSQVRRLLGVGTALYHLSLRPPAELAEHHAAHAGAGLAHAHAAQSREFEAIRAAAPGREDLVDEMEGAAIAGLVRAQALLAVAIAPVSAEVRSVAGTASPDPDRLRQALLRAVRRGQPC
jgi:hypothetical protein